MDDNFGQFPQEIRQYLRQDECGSREKFLKYDLRERKK